MLYQAKYDVPIKGLDYILSPETDDGSKRYMTCVVTYLDGTQKTVHEYYDLKDVQEQLDMQNDAILMGEELKVIRPLVPESFDAQVWAQEFHRLVLSRGVQVETRLMTKWFADALQRGHDEGVMKFTTGQYRPARFPGTYHDDSFVMG